MCDGTDLADRRESTIVVVEVDVALNAGTHLIHCGEDMSGEVLVFEDRPKAFSARMVEAAAGPTHRAGDLGLGAELNDSAIVELAASVGVEGGADPSEPLAELPPRSFPKRRQSAVVLDACAVWCALGLVESDCLDS